MVETHNEGPALVETNYWQTEHASAGYCYLSFNAGAARLLVPPAAHALLAEWPPVGAPVELTRTVEQGRPVYELAWLDDPRHPYALRLDERQSDRLLPAGDAGRTIPLVTYTADPARGPGAVRTVRTEQVTYRGHRGHRRAR